MDYHLVVSSLDTLNLSFAHGALATLPTLVRFREEHLRPQ